MTVEGGDNELTEKVGAIKKICNNLQSQDRKIRKQTYINLENFLSDGKFDEGALRMIFNESYMYFLNGLRDKTETVREQSIKFISNLYINILPLNDYYLTYIFPIMVERIGSVELVEESEEVRLQLLQVIDQIVQRYSNTPQLVPFLNDLVTILAETVKDKHPQIKELSCRIIIDMGTALPRDFHMQAETLVKPVLSCFGHQRYKVRVMAVNAIGEIIMNSTYRALDEAVGPLAERLFDQIPTVRQAVAKVAARWLLDYRDRYSFFHKILPLLLTGLNDEVEDTRVMAHELWLKVGVQFQQENEKDLKDQLDYMTELPKYYPKNLQRPNLGCRVLVQRNVSKIAGAISRELMSWQDDVRVRCSQLLVAIVLHAESEITFNLQDLLPAMYSSSRNEDQRVVDNIIRAAEIIGLFVKFETWSKLVLPAIEDGAHYGHLTVLASLVKGSPKEYISGSIEEISKVLADDLICCSRKKKYQLELKRCVECLMEKLDPDMDNTTGYNIFKIITVLISLKDPDLSNTLTSDLYLKLAESLSLDVKIELMVRYANDLLKHVNVDPKSWTVVTEKACIFHTLLQEMDEAFGINLEIISFILVDVLDTESDADLRLKTFYVLSSIFEKKHVIFKDAVDLTSFLERLITEIFIPSLVWHAGATAEAVRTMATLCLQYALTPHPAVDLFTSSDVLRPLTDKLLPLLLSLVEDASYRSRQAAIECLGMLKENCCRKGIWSTDDLIKVYPEILKRLDDPTEKVRLCALQNLPKILENAPEEFTLANFKAHHELIIDTLLTHFDDDEKIVQDLVFETLKTVVKINKHELVEKIERHRSLVRNQRGCDEVIQYIKENAVN